MGPRSGEVVEVGADALASATRLPSRCAPHGLPAVDRIRVGITSPRPRTRLSDAGAGAVGAISGPAEVLATVRVTRAVGWPVCHRCRRRRRVFRVLTYLSFWGGLAALVTGIVVGVVAEPAAGLLVPTLGGFALMLVSPIPLTLGLPARIARARTTPDGATVQILDPDPEFARELRALVG